MPPGPLFSSEDNNTSAGRSRMLILAVLLGFLLWLTALWLIGCQALNTPVTDSSPTPVESIALQSPSPEAATAPPATPTVPPVITLTIWTAPDYSPQAESPGGEVMRQLLATFNDTQSAVKLQYTLKKPQGKGGLLDFLLTASSVAPTVLPDLILLEPYALRDAAKAGLLQPLDDLLTPALEEDLFPFALEAGRIDGRLQGIQFQTDALHLLYNTNKLQTPPLTWSDVLTRPQARYLFPAAGQGGLAGDSSLVHYLGTGVSLLDEFGQLTLSQEAMTAMLDFYAAGIQSGAVPTITLQLETTLQAWPIYLEAEVAMTEMLASHYLANRDTLRTTSYATIPGLTAPAPSVTRGWMIAIVTDDPYRREAAAHLLEWWLSPDNNTNWNLANGTLPVRRSAYQHLSEQDPYFQFLADLLENAQPYPLTPIYREVAAAWQIAIRAVLNGEQSPQEAAAQVMTTLGQ